MTDSFITSDRANICTPFRPDLATLIPHSRVLEWQGRKMLVIPNQRDENRLARNLGIALPSPILTRYDWRGQTPWDIQRTTAAMLTENPRCYVLSTMGCVDADTEYLSEDGWRRIADYAAGPVAEYRPETGTIAFVEPSKYVKLPCDEMIRFKTTRGVDQLLSPEHRVLYTDWQGNTHVDSAESIYGRYDVLGDRAVRFITTFRVEGGVPSLLTDAELRLHVAISADGYEAYKNRVHIRIKRPRKIERLRILLGMAGVTYSERSVAPAGFRTFAFEWPYGKGFTGGWTTAQRQLEVIADEAAYWDGTHRKAKGLAYSSFDKASADFIQFAYSASGRRASLNVSRRVRDGHDMVEWRVHASNGDPSAGLVGVGADGLRRRNVWREPSPDGFKYCFMVPSTFLLLRRNGCIFATGNTGKTRAALWASDFLMREGTAARVLIVAPLSTLTPVWESELFHTLPDRKVRVLYGDRAKRAKLLSENASYYIINYHGVKLLQQELTLKKFDIVILDELALLRNRSTDLWKTINGVIEHVPYVWGMTGSPTPMAPTDAWAQVRLLTPARTTRSMAQFQDLTMRRLSQFRWIARENANDVVHAAMQPSVRYTRDDVMELPPTTYVDRQVKLEPLAQKAYDMLFNKMKTFAGDGTGITAVNEGVLQSKLLQVACGYIYTDQVNGAKQVYALPNATRLAALDEIVNECDEKVIVFVPFVHAIEGIVAHLKSKGHDVAMVHGGVSRGKRDIIFAGFQKGTSPRVIVSHPGCMAHGLTLTAASTIVWFAPTSSLELYEQANARIVRPGQTAKTFIVHLVGTPVERATYSRLKTRGKMQGMLLVLFQQQSLDL